MGLNLIEDSWIPVLDANGQRRMIAPWQMVEPGLVRPNWPRPDLNIACLELLIGLVFLADPPEGPADWRARRKGDAERLQAKLADFAPAFNLTGDGPLFLQDLEKLEGEANPVDMLFIDSAGGNTSRNNADLMVHRKRYPALEPGLAAMALYAFQAHAPAGGAGNRTSLRGGGPLVTLVDPGDGLWSLIWANVPHGAASLPQDLPWMRPARVSDHGQETLPPSGGALVAETFFGMPRRLRLLETDGAINGMIQKPWGTNYRMWVHPLTPYYRQKPGEELLPVHPRAGLFGYRNWLGILAEEAGSETTQLAEVLRLWEGRRATAKKPVSIIVAGWAMDNMKPRDFTLSVQPEVVLPPEAEYVLAGLILAADKAAVALRGALEPLLGDSARREGEREAFFIATQASLLDRIAQLRDGRAAGEVAADWLADLRQQALQQFDALALPGLDQRETDRIQTIVAARSILISTFSGHGKLGGEIFAQLGLARPEAAKKRGKAA